MTAFIKSHKVFVFFIFFMLLLFHGVNNYYILTNSKYCLSSDSVLYFERVNQILQILRETKLDPKSLYTAYDKILRYGFRPPLFFITASPFLLLGLDKNNVIMANLIYFAILLFSTYGIGRELYEHKVGILSAFLVSMFPAVFALSRVLMLDFGLAAMVTLTFYLFILNKFRSFKFSLLTGIVIGLGSLSKQSYFILIIPILFYFFLQKDNRRNKRIMSNFIFSAVLGLLIGAAYYARVGHDHNYYYFNIFQCKTHTNPFFYLQGILNRQLLPVFSLIFLAGLSFCFRRKKYLLPIIISIFLLVFSISPNKQDRFILPIFPYVAIIISGFILSLSKIRRASIVILVLFSFLQYFTISYGNILSFPHNLLQKFSLNLSKEKIDESGLFFIVDEGDWQGSAEKIIKIINGDIEKNKINNKTKILLISQDWRVYTTIDYLRIINDLPIELHKSEIDSDIFDSKKEIDGNFDNQIIRSDFVIMGEVPRDTSWYHTENLHKAFMRKFDNFVFIKTVLFPDDSLYRIYKAKKI